MTDIKKKALALVNEVAKHYRANIGEADFDEVERAFYRVIEQHEAFRQEVSDAVEGYTSMVGLDPKRYFARFIIAKPDPLVEVWDHMIVTGNFGPLAFRAAIEARGGRIVWEGE